MKRKCFWVMMALVLALVTVGCPPAVTPPVSEISMTASTADVPKGFSGNIASIVSVITTDGPYTWSISGIDEELRDYVSIEENGNLTVDAEAAVQKTFVVRATLTAGGKYDETTITVVYANAEEVIVTSASTSVILGTIVGVFEEQFSATVEPNPAASQSVMWSVAPVTNEATSRRARFVGLQDAEPSGVAISDCGLLTVEKNATQGIWVVTATAANGITGTKEMTIVLVPPESIDVDPASVDVERGTPEAIDLEELFGVQVYPPEAFQYVTWKIEEIFPLLNEPTDIYLTPCGFLMIEAGVPVPTTINVRIEALGFDDVYIPVTINVGFREPANIMLEPEGSVDVARGTARIFTASIQPPGADQNIEITWQSIVSEAEGRDGITLIPNGLTATLEISETVDVSRIIVVRATATDTDLEIGHGETAINVIYPPAESIAVTPGFIFQTLDEISGGAYVNFSATVEPYPAASQVITWSVAPVAPAESQSRRLPRFLGAHSNEPSVSIDESTGVLTIAGNATTGRWIITATAANGETGEGILQIIEAAPESILVDIDEENVLRGTPADLTPLFGARVYPANAPQALVWEVTSNHAAGVIDLTGDRLTVTANTATAVTLRVSADGFEAAYTYVTARLTFAPPEEVIVTPNFSPITRGSAGSVQFSARVEPYPIASQAVTWGTNGNPASGLFGANPATFAITNAGLLTANNPGLLGGGGAPFNSTWEVRATAGGITGTAAVRVVEAIPTGINVASTVVDVQRGTSPSLTALFGAMVLPLNAPALVWSIASDPAPEGVTLAANGNLTVAEDAPPETFTARVRTGPAPYFDEFTREVTVNIITGGPSSVTINRAGLPTTIERPGGILPLTATVTTPAGASGLIEWSVSPVSAGTFSSASEHTTDFIVAGNAELGNITITARAVFGDVQDQVPVEIVQATFPIDVRRGGVNPYGHHMGAINHRGLAYSFDATGSDSYTLYFIAGIAEAAAVISGGTAVSVEPRTADNPGFIGGVSSYSYELVRDSREAYSDHTWLINVSYVILPNTPVFDVDGTYSVVVVGRTAGEADIVSSVARINRVPNNILTIPDIPAARSDIRVATVMNATSGTAMATDRSTLTVGYRLPGTNTFVFYQLTPGSKYPYTHTRDWYDSERPWIVNISRPVALASAERQPNTIFASGDDYYRFITASGFLFGFPNVNSVSITNRTTLTWSQFEQQ